MSGETQNGKMSAEELADALLELDGEASHGSFVWQASQRIRAHIAAIQREAEEANARVAAMLEVFGGYCTPEVDAAINYMQSVGLDVWSMQRLMDNRAPLEKRLIEMREALEASYAWLDRWAVHVGNCRGASTCTCGLTLVRCEADAALSQAAEGV